MGDEITKFFKVHWMNTSLKFIKNDSELVLEYPEMAIEQVEFLNRSIWQRKYDEPDLESIFSAICEALKTFTLKYQFKVLVTKSGNIGKLKVQKIPKTGENTDGQAEIQDMPTAKDSGINKLGNKNKISKIQKYYVVIRKIIDSVTPSFLRINFQKILDFIKDESSGSIIFGDLTPSEALFLENFLGVFNKRETFSGLFSESCNEILEKFAKAYKEFEKNAKLEICVVKTNERTRKREITFLKAPKYTNNTTLKAKLIKNQNQNKENSSPEDKLAPVTKLLKALNVDDIVKNKNLHTASENTSTSKNIKIEPKLTKDKTNHNVENDIKDIQTDKKDNFEAVKSISVTINNKRVTENPNENVSNKIVLVNTQIDNKHDSNSNSISKKNIDKKSTIDSRASEKNKSQVQTTIGKTDLSKDATSSSPQLSKSVLIAKPTEDTKDKNVEAKGNAGATASPIKAKHLEAIKSDKGLSSPQSSKSVLIEKPTEDTKDKNVEAKRNAGATASPIKAKHLEAIKSDKGLSSAQSRKAKLLEAMSTPIECDKGLRMMRLMGWEGGALGQRGEGITEPIIPEINRTTGAGLGHVPKVKLTKKQIRSIRSGFFDAILRLLNENRDSINIYFETELTVKDEHFYDNMINQFNKRKVKLGLIKKVYMNASEIALKLLNNKFLFLEIQFSACKRIVTVTNSIHPDLGSSKEIIEKNIIVQNKTKEKTVYKGLLHTEFKTIVATKILDLLKNSNDKCLVSFDNVLKPKSLRFVDMVLNKINNNRCLKLTKKYEPIVKDINLHLDNNFLTVKLNEDLRSFTLHKIKEYSIETINSTKENKLNNETQVLKKVNNAIDIKNKLDLTIDKNNNGDNPKTIEKENAMKKPNSYILLIEPEIKMDRKEFVKTITNLITSKIDKEVEFLPYLKCHGIQNGYLVYSCQDKKSCLWLKFVLCQYQIIDYIGIYNKHVLQMKINVQMDVKKVLSLLAKYNKGLSCLSWEILESSKSLVEFLVKMDLEDFEFVCDKNFRLNAGVDEVEFNINHFVEVEK